MRTNQRLAGVLCALASLIPLAATGNAPGDAPIPGPGGVIETMKSYLAAVDANDADALEELIQRGDPGITLHRDPKTGELRAGKGFSFQLFERDVDGQPRGAVSPKETCELIRSKLLGHGKLRCESQIDWIRADCPSPRTSYAIFAFDRTWFDAKGNEVRRQPLMVTAHVMHDSEEGVFRLTHLHVSERRTGKR